jgi:hypothetical protein
MDRGEQEREYADTIDVGHLGQVDQDKQLNIADC